ncbi:MAG: zf-HC2 domain-containing protein [Moraxellaceae bacterium]|nr:zf-HC2 domain-containing protein [Moraxellaceae bacterium]
MLNCHDATRLMSDSQERTLKLGERFSLKMHVSMCAGCRNFGKQMGTIRKISRSYAKRPEDKPSSDS